MIEPCEITEHFRLERVLKSSRSGIVFRAIDPTSQDPVVIKLITPGGPGDQHLGLEHFSTAVQALTRVRIPGFPLLLDWGWTPDMSAFMVMEFLAGTRLDTLTGAPPARILGLLIQLIDALEALAAADIVHGNVAPENLMAVPEEGGEYLAVLGFGTAAFRWPTMAPVRWGLESSTADFMAPEWVTPPAGGAPDWRADLYAFAQTACRLLNVDVLDIGDGPPTIALPPEVHEAVPDGDRLEAILTQALEHDPAQRPSSWSEVRGAFAAAAGAEAVDGSPYRTRRMSPDQPVSAETIRIPVAPTAEPTSASFDDGDDIGRTKVLTPERLAAMKAAEAAARGTVPAACAASDRIPGNGTGLPAVGTESTAARVPSPESATTDEAAANPPSSLITGWKLERTQAFPTPTTELAADSETAAPQSALDEENLPTPDLDAAATLASEMPPGSPASQVPLGAAEPASSERAAVSFAAATPHSRQSPPGPVARDANTQVTQAPLITAKELERTEAFTTLAAELPSSENAAPQSALGEENLPAPTPDVATTLVSEVPPGSPAPQVPLGAAEPAPEAAGGKGDESPIPAVDEAEVAWPAPTPAIPPPPPSVAPPPNPPVAVSDAAGAGESSGAAPAVASVEFAPEGQVPLTTGPAEIPETTRVVAPAALPAQRPTPPPARARRRWWPWALAACLVIAALGIGGVLLWQQQEEAAARVRAAARPTQRPPTPRPTLGPSAPPAAVAVVDALADALGRGDLKSARQTLDRLTPEARTTLPSEETSRLGELEIAFVAARREHTIRQLRRGFQAGDIRMLRDALAGATREDLALFGRDADTAQTVEEARRAVNVYSLLQRATTAGNHAEVLQEAQTLLQLLAKSPQALEARGTAAAALEAQADAAVRGGQWDLATTRLDAIRRFWPDRPGLAARFDRIAGEREADDRVERAIAAAGRAEAERQPEKGLDALRAVTPTVRTHARWDEAKGRLDRLLVEVDAASPAVELRPGFKLQYDKGKLATIAVRARDDHAVKEVRVFARVEGSATFQEFPANRGAAGEWSVELSPSFHGNKTVEFYVVATDVSGHAGNLGGADKPLKLKKKGWLF